MAVNTVRVGSPSLNHHYTIGWPSLNPGFKHKNHCESTKSCYLYSAFTIVWLYAQVYCCLFSPLVTQTVPIHHRLSSPVTTSPEAQPRLIDPRQPIRHLRVTRRAMQRQTRWGACHGGSGAGLIVAWMMLDGSIRLNCWLNHIRLMVKHSGTWWNWSNLCLNMRLNKWFHASPVILLLWLNSCLNCSNYLGSSLGSSGLTVQWWFVSLSMVQDGWAKV